MATAKKSKGTLSTDKRNSLDEGKFAFPKERKEPLNNAAHVRNAIARFDQVKNVSEAEKAAAFKRIKAAAKNFGVDMTAGSEGDLEPKGPAKKKAASKEGAAKKSPAKTASDKGSR